ncbi:radical SAM/SPASM domain-containing protein [Gottfriedia sp. NPDC056225]|uniref:radical SAM protein n=1 Tax=Gottfriedia sp. NPDC056225 TaxID=3345751 RepID=UPI0035D5736E
MFLLINPKVKIVENFKGASILMVKDKKILTKNCNHSGLYILKMCNGINSFNDILKKINEDYGEISLEKQESVRSFLQEYIADKIVEEINFPNEVDLNVIGDGDLVVPISISMELTNRCQLKCLHCFNESGKARENEINIDKFVEIAKTFVDIGASTFFITGGEPLLKSNVEKLIKLLGENARSCTIATNGMILREELLLLISNYPNIGIQISLDGIEKNHDYIRGVRGAFKNTINNIKRLTNKNIPVSISYTMNDHNKDDLIDLIQLCKSIKCVGISIGLTSIAGRAKKNNIPVELAREFTDILGDYHQKYSTDDFYVGLDICERKINKIMDSIEHPNKCGAGYQLIHILSNGKVTPCPAIQNIILGDVNESDMLEILNINNLKRIIEYPTPSKKICGDCIHYNTCGNCIASMMEVDERDCHVQREYIK